jgi:hypothetical protein
MTVCLGIQAEMMDNVGNVMSQYVPLHPERLQNHMTKHGLFT